MKGVKTWLSSQAEDFFDTDIQKLIPRCNCLNSGDDYFEKWLKYLRNFLCITFISLVVTLTAHFRFRSDYASYLRMYTRFSFEEGEHLKSQLSWEVYVQHGLVPSLGARSFRFLIACK
jgi:hypothetical protein